MAGREDRLTVYFDRDDYDLKAQLQALSEQRRSVYAFRSLSSIAAMLLRERIEELRIDEDSQIGGSS